MPFSCLINKDHFYWQNSRIPESGTYVYFEGHALPVDHAPMVVLEVDAFSFDFSFDKVPHVEPPPKLLTKGASQELVVCGK